MNNAKDQPNTTHFKLRSKLNFRKTSSKKY